MSKWLAAAAVVVLGTGCHYGASAFTCSAEKSCGLGGTCEPNGFCSFDDSSCQPSGRRYGDLSGPLSGMCVDTQSPDIDAAVDTPSNPPPDGQACFGTGIVKVCLAATPTQPLTISDALTIDTSNSSMCAATVSGGTNYCVVAATSIIVNATLRAKGTKPLVLIASDTITVNQLIDVASHRTIPEFVGAGADPVACTVGALPDGNRSGGAGGVSLERVELAVMVPEPEEQEEKAVNQRPRQAQIMSPSCEADVLDRPELATARAQVAMAAAPSTSLPATASTSPVLELTRREKVVTQARVARWPHPMPLGLAVAAPEV